MRDLLLAHGYFLFEDPKERQIMKPYAPLGILYLCSRLRSKGFDVDVYDTTFSSREELFTFPRSEPPSVLGLYANLTTRGNVVEILRVAQEAGWTKVVGGPEPGAYTLEYLREGADFAVSGEGEVTMEELLLALRTGAQDLTRIAGLSYMRNGLLQPGTRRGQNANLDLQPWPARDAINIRRYLDTWRHHHGTGSVNFITARWCSFHCNWCSHQVYDQSHRRRDPVLVVDEVVAAPGIHARHRLGFRRRLHHQSRLDAELWGYEGEELEDIEATIKHVSVSKPDIFFTTVSCPIKGTPYYEKISDKLVQLAPWSVTSDRELKIKGRHKKQFYSHVDKLFPDFPNSSELVT